jgi:hypothetical protein
LPGFFTIQIIAELKPPPGMTIDLDRNSTDQVQIQDLQLSVGASMLYVFDFGDWWEFTVQLEKIDSEDT